MESKRIHQKISITVKNQNYLNKGQFDQKIGKILKKEQLRKRKNLDRRANQPILSKTKPDWTDPEIQRAKWIKFVVSLNFSNHFSWDICAVNKVQKLVKTTLQIFQMLVNVASFSSWIDTSVQ